MRVNKIAKGIPVKWHSNTMCPSRQIPQYLNQNIIQMLIERATLTESMDNAWSAMLKSGVRFI